MIKFYSFVQTKLSAFAMFAGIVAVLLITPSQTFATSGGGGGGSTGPSFSDGMPGSSSGCGSGTIDNKGATVAKGCHPDALDYDPCPNELADCQYIVKGAGCWYDTCTCWGSMENNIWSQFCAPATGTFVFEVSNISCSGGATSLQFMVAPTPSSWSSVCDLTSVYCNDGFTGNVNMSVDLTSGQCYTLMFDGNAGAECSWTFNINCTYALGITMLDYNIDFDGKQNKATFNWEVDNENNVSHYTVQRSSDGITFENIGSLNAKNNSSTRLNYSFIDNNPLPKTSYYRLLEKDLDGKEYIYKRLVITNKNSFVTIYPNPIANDLNLNFGKELEPGTEITVYGVTGNVIYSTTLTHHTSQHKIDMNECAKGMYFLSIKSGDLVMQQKFFKD
jgi:hypothetical protein